ncbi:MAG: O-antigen ligase family protein [Anaerolineaceae bacterium]|nr:O-antigen ligase family protein [Anaerolineaceae bacterium]
MKTYRPALYLLPVTLFVASALPAAFVGYNPGLAWPTLAVLLAGGLLSAALALAGRKTRPWEAAAGLFVLLCVLVAGYVITQMGRLDYDEKVGVISSLATLIAHVTPNLARWQPDLNSVATFIEAAPFIAVGLAFSTSKRKLRFLWLGAAAILLGGLLFSASRGAWLAVAGGMLLWAACYWKPARWLAFGAAAGMAGLILYVLARGDITAIGDIPVLSSVLGPLFIRPDRLEVYRNSLALIADTPFTGIGLGEQFALVYSRYELLIPFLYLSYSHNLTLETLLQQGLAGFVAWMGLTATVFSAAWNHRHHPQRLKLESTWVGIAVILLHGISDARQYDDLRCWLPFFLLLGLNIALLWNHAPEKPRLAWMLPVGAAALSLGVYLAMLGSLPAATLTNRGALLQQRADLQAGLSGAEQASLREGAKALFLEALEREPGQRSANQRLGMIYLEQLDYPTAITVLEQALLADPEHPGTRKALGLAYAWAGRTEEALPLLHGLPNIVDEMNYWAWHFDDLNNPRAGYHSLLVSLALQPDQPEMEEYAEILKEKSEQP